MGRQATSNMSENVWAGGRAARRRNGGEVSDRQSRRSVLFLPSWSWHSSQVGAAAFCAVAGKATHGQKRCLSSTVPRHLAPLESAKLDRFPRWAKISRRRIRRR
jgi:hypothetical protein